MKVGVIAALPAEFRCLSRSSPEPHIPLTLSPDLTGVVCGIGAENAARAAVTLLRLKVNALISWGTAGALAPQLHAGDLLLPETILAEGNLKYMADLSWLNRIRQSLRDSGITWHDGPMLECRKILTTREQKADLYAHSGAIAVDMESAVIMQQATAAKLPGIVIRSVVDEAATAIPQAILRRLDDMGRPDLAGLLVDMVRAPRLLGALWQLGIAMHKATATLRVVARHGGPSLVFNK